MTDIFKPGVIQNMGFTNSLLKECDYQALFNNLNSNSINAIEPFKTLSRSFGNLNLAFNNVNNYYNEGVSMPSSNSERVISNVEPVRSKPRFSSIPMHKYNNLNNPVKKDFLNKMRRRSIKNNKIVFCHSLGSRKIVQDKVNFFNFQPQEVKVEGTIEEEIPIDEHEEEEELKKELKVNYSEPVSMINGKKPRGSRYRGVSRNGNQWQVDYIKARF